MPTEMLTQHVQDCLLKLMVTDDKFISMVVGIIEPDMFGSWVMGMTAECAIQYYKAHKEAPKNHFHDEITRRVSDRSDTDRQLADKYVQRLHDLHQPNADYILSRVVDFIKFRRRKRDIERAAILLSDGLIDDCDKCLMESLRDTMPQQDAGIEYLKHNDVVPNEKPVLVGTGFKALDSQIRGFTRGQLVVVLGGYKAGKTWWMSTVAEDALMRGLRVLHVTLEVGLQEQITRYDMQFTARGTRNIGEKVRAVVWDNTRQMETYQYITVKHVYENPALVYRARRRMKRWGGSLRIIKYPSGQLTPAELEQKLIWLEEYAGFVPDVLLLDYIDLMNLTTFDKYEKRHQLNGGYIWAKGLADDRRIVVITGSQITSDALDRRRIRMKHVAEDRRKVGNCDVMLGIGRSQDDERYGTGGVTVLANRNGPQGRWCLFSSCLPIGRMVWSSWVPPTEDAAI